MAVQKVNNQLYVSGQALDGRVVRNNYSDITNIANAYVGMLVYVVNEDKYYKVTSLTQLGKPAEYSEFKTSSSTYKPSGSKTVAQLTSSLLVEANLGNIYNITDGGTTTSDFVEGSGHPIASGANVAIVDISSTETPNYKFDLVGGFIDLSNYQPKITSSNKLSADFIQDGTTNKTVTATEKTTWSNKQDALSQTQLDNIALGGTAIQPSNTAGLLQNNGDVDTTTQAKANNAIQMPSGGEANKILEYDATNGVKWADKPSNGKSAYQLYVDGGGELSPEAWLASLKANIGEFLFVPTDAAAVTAMGAIGQTYSSAIDPQGKNVAPTQNTLSVILLMNAGTTPDKTMMIATQEVTPATTPASYEFIYAGDLQSAMSSNVLTQTNIVNDLTTGGTTNVASAESLKKVAYCSNNGNDDLNIIDEQANILAKFSNGGIKTKNFDSSITPYAEPSAQNSDLDISDKNNNTIVRFSNGGIKTKNFDSSNPLNKSAYLRRNFFTHNVNVTNFIQADYNAKPNNTQEQTVYYIDNCVFYLPVTYSVAGIPTKVVIYCKEGATHIEESSDTVLDRQKIMRYLLYLGYAVLAADGVPNGWATAISIGERAVGNYVAVQSTIKAWNHVKNNFNVDADSVYIFGYSQGGHYAQNVIDNTNIPIAACAMLSPALSMRWHQWDLMSSVTVDGVTFDRAARLNIARIFDFPAVTTNAELELLEYDADKTIGYDPWTRNVENIYNSFVPKSSGSFLWTFPNDVTVDDITMKKHTKCPVKIWAAENDNYLGIDIMRAFVKAIRNTGQIADIIVYQYGGHEIPQYQVNNNMQIGTFVENGETLNLYPIAREVAIWFYNFGGYNLI